jgi:hypothetical protein
MFQLIAGAAAAWNQVGLLVGGALFAGIGALLLGSRLHWRLRASRVTATVAGVRPSSGHTFFPVYRYTLPNGVSGEATSDTGSSATESMRTGRTAEIFVFPEHPDKATEADAWVQEMIGAVFLAAGCLLLYIALFVLPFTRYTALMAVVMGFYAAAKFRKFIPAPGDRPRTPLMQKLQRMNIETAPVTPIEQLEDSGDVLIRVERQRGSLRKAAPFFVLFAMAMLVLTVYLARGTARLETRGLRAPGTVIALDRQSDSDGASTYHAIVRFTDASGASIQFRDAVGTNPPSHKAGDTVTVMYLAGDAQKSAAVDRGIWNWLPPAAVGAFGLIFLAAGVSGWRRSSQSTPSPLALDH